VFETYNKLSLVDSQFWTRQSHLTSTTNQAMTMVPVDERVKIFEEIKETERRYLQHLDQLTKIFLQPLQQKKIGPQGKEFKNLISTLSMIVNFNSFLNNMLNKTTADSVGKIFQQVIPFLKTYREYFNNYEKAQNDIRQQKKENKKFAEWLDKTERECKRKGELTMNQLLIMPIQRIPRYNLLLRVSYYLCKELIRHRNSLKTQMKSIQTIKSSVMHYKRVQTYQTF
jgi:hypothetical protein